MFGHMFFFEVLLERMLKKARILYVPQASTLQVRKKKEFEELKNKEKKARLS